MWGPVILFLVSVLMVVPAAAETCVGPAFDRPFPGAVDVNVHQADVRSAQFPGVWQSGIIEGQFYQIFANKVAVLQSERASKGWSITVDCQQEPCTKVTLKRPPELTKAIAIKLERCLAPVDSKVHAIQAAKISKHDPKTSAILRAVAASRNNLPPENELHPKQKLLALSVVKAPDTPKKSQVFAAGGQSAGDAATPPVRTSDKKKVQARAKAWTRSTSIVLEGLGNVTLVGKPFFATKAKTTPSSGKLAAVTHSQSASNAPETELVCLPVSRKKPVVAAAACGLAKIPLGDPVATLQRLLAMAGANPGVIDGTFGILTEKAMYQVLGVRSKQLNVYEAIAAVNTSLCNK